VEKRRRRERAKTRGGHVARFASDFARHPRTAREGRRAEKRGYVWVREEDLPEAVIKVYELLKEQ
jgi:hypothetical protein